MDTPIKVGILGLSQRVGRFNELGLRSWEEAGCAEVERHLMDGEGESLFLIHRPLVIRGGVKNFQRLLREWCDAPNVEARCDLILTVDGTGIGPDDVLPEATAAVIQRPVSGIADFVRHIGYLERHPDAVMSRGLAGLRRHTLIINLPGPDQALVGTIMAALTPMLPAFIKAARESGEK